jgi:hypothetical protein
LLRWTEQVHQVAATVAGELHLEMARVENIFLEQHRIVAEGGLGLGLRRIELGCEIIGTIDPAHAAPAAAGRRLDQDRKPDLAGSAGEPAVVLRVTVIAGHGGHAGGCRDALGFDFRAHPLHRHRGGSDENQPGGFAVSHKGGILRQKAVSGMDGVGVGPFRRRHDRMDVEIARARRRRADPDRLIGGPDVDGVDVGIGVDRDGADAEAAAGSHHAQRDLAAIGDQHRANWAGRIEKRHDAAPYMRYTGR